MSDELIEGVKVVENGAAHILRLQNEGYKYQVMFFWKNDNFGTETDLPIQISKNIFSFKIVPGLKITA